MFQTKFQQNIPCASAEKVDFIGLAIFSYSGHFKFSTKLNLISLKPCSLLMLHVKFENYGCSCFRECHLKMDLNTSTDVNFARVDINFQKVTEAFFPYRFVAF